MSLISTLKATLTGHPNAVHTLRVEERVIKAWIHEYETQTAKDASEEESPSSACEEACTSLHGAD